MGGGPESPITKHAFQIAEHLVIDFGRGSMSYVCNFCGEGFSVKLSMNPMVTYVRHATSAKVTP